MIRKDILLKILLLVYFFLSSRAILHLWFEISGLTLETSKGNIFFQIIWAIYYVIFFVLIIPKRKKLIGLIKNNYLFILLIMLPLISLFWSGSPEVTTRRVIGLFGSTMIFVYVVLRFNEEEIIKLFSSYFIIATVLSLLTIFLLPTDIGTMGKDYNYAWRGIYPVKNLFGRLMALGMSIYMILAMESRKYRMINLFLSLLCLMMVFFSKSIGGIVIALGLITFIFIFPLLKIRSIIGFTLAITIVIIVFGIMIIGLEHFNFLMKNLGKDPTMTGRTIIWALSWGMIQKEFIWGYGYNAFWVGWDGPSREIWKIAIWEPSHAHNGIFDLWLDLGLIGIIIFLLCYLQAFIRAYNYYNHNRFLSILPITILVYVFVANSIESFILKQNDFQWGLFVIISTLLSKKTKIE